MTEFSVVIPVRLASQRLPDKPLIDIAGMTMIERVYRQAARSGASEIIVATDAQAVAEVCRAVGARVEMTAADHASGTDRIAEVAKRSGWAADRIVVNVQGDEPLIPPRLIDQVAGLLAADAGADMATLITPLEDESEYADPNMVKVVSNRSGEALYFSRAPIPADRDGGVPAHARRHIGIYAYRARSLIDLASAPAAPAERAERLEQLRALWLGQKILVADALEPPPRGVDTPEDLAIIRELVGHRERGI